MGTISIEKSERLAKVLARDGIKHSVLNAKNHQLEAEIVSQAGQKGVVTISTNMAGRGTDIVLGEGVTLLGGLHILGTERHESRRIDNQLRGRSGRQGDPGSSRFYLSLEDDLLRIFGSDRIAGLMGKMGMEEGEPIEHSLISKAIENAQRRVEGHNFEIRKHLIEYDDVMNQQREVVYGQRRKVLEGKDLREMIREMTVEIVDGIMDIFVSEKISPEEWDLKSLADKLFQQFSFKISFEGGETLPEPEDFKRTGPGAGLVPLSKKSGNHRSGSHGLPGTDGYAGDDRYDLEGSSAQHGSSKRRNRTEGLWATGPPTGISTGRL